MAIPYVSGRADIYIGLGNSQGLQGSAFNKAVSALSRFSVGSSLGGTGVGGKFGATSSASAIYYLGTCENGITIRGVPEFEPVMNDIGGTRKPFDRLYQGEDALSIGVLTRWNETVYQFMASIPSAGVFPGICNLGNIGTLMITEGFAYEVYLQFPYAAKTLFSANGMPPGYRFPFSYLEGPIEQERGTKPNKRHLTFYHGRGYDPSTGGFLLYDFNMTPIPAIPPNPATANVAPG